jgi:hypothetical protein
MMTTRYQTVDIDGLKAFYRETGRPMRRLCFCCTGFRRHRGCGSR